MSTNPEFKNNRGDWGWLLSKLQSLTRKRRKRLADKQRRRREDKDTRQRIDDMGR